MKTTAEVLEAHMACAEGVVYAREHASQTPKEFFDGCVANDEVWLGMGAAGFFCTEFSGHCGGECLCGTSKDDPRWVKVRERFIEECRGK